MFARIAKFEGLDMSNVDAQIEDEDGLRRGDEALNAMSPPEGAGQRSNVEMYEVALEMKND